MERRRLMGKLFAYIIYSITNVNKKYGNSSFVNPLSMSGNGTVTYTSNNTAVATIDNNGNVTIIAPGEAIITASVEDTLDFEYENNSASYTLIVAKADGNVSEPPTPKTIVYDGDDHQLINAGIGTGTMLYKFDYDEEWDEIIPTASESGTYTILYKSSENQYYTESSIGTVDVTIQKALSQYIAPTPVSPLVYNTNAQNLLNEGSTNDGLIYYSTDEINWSTNVPQGTNAGEYRVYWKLVGDYNHTDISSTLIIVEMDKVTPTVTPPCEGVVIPYDGETHELIQCGSTDYGTLKYSLDGVTYSTTVPTASAMDDYIIYWMVEGNSNVNDIEPLTVQASISGIIVLNPTINLEYNLIDYDGTAKQPSVEVLDDDSNIIPSSEYTVTYSNNVNAGTATVTITDVIGGTYIISGTKTFTINKIPCIYIAPTANNTTYDCNALNLLNPGSVTSGGTIQYSSDNLTWSTTVPQETNVGNYISYWEITPSDNNHYGVDSTSIQTTISKCTVVVVVPTAKVLTYNGSAQVLANAGSVTSPSCANGMEYSLDNSTWSSSVPSATNGGAYTVYYRVQGNSNINGVSGSINCSIGEKPVTATVTVSPTSYNYDGTAKLPTVTVKDGNTTIPSSEYTVTYSNNINASTNDTKATVTITDKTGGNWNVIGSTTFTINEVSPIYTAPTAKSLTYNGNALVLLNAGSTSDGTIQYSSDNSTWSTTIPSLTNANTYTTYWRLIGDNNHTDISSTRLDTTIAKANISPIVSLSGWNCCNSANNPSVSGNSGGGSVTYNYKVSTAADSTYTATKPSNPGTYTVRAQIAVTTNYNAGTATSNFTISKCNISPSVSMSGWTYGGTASNPSVSGNSGGGSVTYNYKVSTAADSTYTATKPTNAGTYTVRALIAATTCYNAGTTTTNFTISQASISPTVSMSGWSCCGTASNPSVSGNSGSGSVTYNYKVSTAADSTYTTTKPSNPGTYTVRALVAATTNYKSGTCTTNFTISKCDLSFSVSGRTLTYNESALNLVTTSGTSVGTVTYTVSGSSTNSIPTSTGCGSYSIAWSSSGSTCYNSKSGTVSTTINKGSTTISANPTAKTLTYNGSAQTLLLGGTSNRAGSWSYGSGTYVNTYNNVAWSFTPSNSCYESKSGTVSGAKINARAITVSGNSASYSYNGSSKSVSGGSITSGSLGSGDTITITASGASGTNAGTYTNSITSVVIKKGSTDVTNQYSITKVNGTLSISKINCSGPTVSSRGILSYNRSAQSLASVSDNCGVMHYRLGTSGSWITSIPTATDIGSYTVLWYMDASTNYNGKGSSSSPAGSVNTWILPNYINLGFTSGTLWSYTNIGSANEGSVGNYYMYGYTSTYNSSNSYYTGTENPLATSRDAAYKYEDYDAFNFGSNWRTPMLGLIQELLYRTTITEVTANGNACYKIVGPNGNYIIVPRGGYYTSGTLGNSGNYARMWSSTPSPVTANKDKAYMFTLSSNGSGAGTVGRALGFNIRPVRNTIAHNFVDLGLPSGRLWADCNIGASIATDVGYYFSWGNVTSHAAGSGYSFSGTNYNSTTGHNLSSSIPANTTYDAARYHWGGNWRMPTADEFKELCDNTTVSYENYNNRKCIKFTNKTYSARFIVLPCGGGYNGGTSLILDNTRAYYWASTYANANVAYQFTGQHDASAVVPKDLWTRSYGLNIRPVM